MNNQDNKDNKRLENKLKEIVGQIEKDWSFEYTSFGKGGMCKRKYVPKIQANRVVNCQYRISRESLYDLGIDLKLDNGKKFKIRGGYAPLAMGDYIFYNSDASKSDRRIKVYSPNLEYKFGISENSEAYDEECRQNRASCSSLESSWGGHD